MDSLIPISRARRRFTGCAQSVASDPWHGSDSDTATVKSSSPGTLGSGVRQTDTASRLPVHACVQASELSPHNVLQHGLVQAQICHQLFKLRVLFFQLLEPTSFRRAQSGIFLLPVKERRLRNVHLAAHLVDCWPSSCCFNAYAICSSVKRDFFTACTFRYCVIHAEYSNLKRDYLPGGDQLVL
jgi:hypothetical protein